MFMDDTTSATASLMESVGSDDQDDDDDDDISRASLHGVGLASQLRYDYADSVDDLRCAKCCEVLQGEVVQAVCGHRIDSHCYKQIMYVRACDIL